MSQFDQIVKNIALENEKCNYNPKKDTNWNDVGWEVQDKCVRRMDFKTQIGLLQTCKHEEWFVGAYALSFVHITDNIAAESRKCDYNPRKDTNWAYLPKKLKEEVVKRMDFRTRTCLSATSKTEKSLVETKKISFERLLIELNSEVLEWKVRAESKFGNAFKIDVRTKYAPSYGCIVAILQHADVDNFRFFVEDDSGNIVMPVLMQFAKCAPFRFKRVSVFCNRFIDFFIKNCPNLEKVDFGGEHFVFPHKKLLKLPSIIKVKEFKLIHVHQTDITEFLQELVQKWIDNDAETGKSVQFDVDREEIVDPVASVVEHSENVQFRTGGFINTFAEKFSDRIIEKTDQIVRIRMDNPTTQILLRRVGSRRDVFFFTNACTNEFMSCKVVPIDMPESEYANGDGWIQATMEAHRKSGGKLENGFEGEDRRIWWQ